MMAKIEKRMGRVFKSFVWPWTKRGAVSRAAFCRRMAKELEGRRS